MGGRLGFALIAFTFLLTCCHVKLNGQAVNDSAAFHYKLDYNVPESPGFSILDANPTTVMRASAAQEVVVNIANTLLAGKNLEPGVAVDFNPYFILGGRLDNINEYREKAGKRFLANTQLSMASTSMEEFPNDLFISSGIRFTLFDSKDQLYDEKLIQDIGNALTPDVYSAEQIKNICEASYAIGQVTSVQECVTDLTAEQELRGRSSTTYNDKVKKAYDDSKERLRNQNGGALSLGYAAAGRARASSLEADSISIFRHQVWLSGQYDFGKALSVSSILMYRYNALLLKEDRDEVMAGLGLRHTGNQTNLFGELTWSSLGGGIDFRANLEIRLIPRLILYVSAGSENDLLNAAVDRFIIRPGIKWNLSEH
jgi:hypothetical protein